MNPSPHPPDLLITFRTRPAGSWTLLARKHGDIGASAERQRECSGDRDAGIVTLRFVA